MLQTSPQEFVWGYPRPPRVEDSSKHIQVIFDSVVIADTHRAKRVLEKSHPPVYYISTDDIQMQYLMRTTHVTVCEWKGQAAYYTVEVNGRQALNAAWTYLHPPPDFAAIKDYVAFYPQLMDVCYVDGEQVSSQPGNFYGGWITSNIIGPFKGEPGIESW